MSVAKLGHNVVTLSSLARPRATLKICKILNRSGEVVDELTNDPDDGEGHSEEVRTTK